MAQSLFKVLMRRNPGPTIDVLAPVWSRPLLERMPEVAGAIDMPLGHGKFGLGTRWRLGRIPGLADRFRLIFPIAFPSNSSREYAPKVPMQWIQKDSLFRHLSFSGGVKAVAVGGTNAYPVGCPVTGTMMSI